MSIRENYSKLKDEIDSVKNRLKADYEISIVAVTKTKPVQMVREVIDVGALKIGENRVQEAEEKFAGLTDLRFEKHLIGHLQENKANKAAELFDVIQSVDSWKVAAKLNRKCEQMDKTLPILIEVKTSDEATKFGVDPKEVEDFTGKLLTEAPQLKVSGFMTIAPFTDDERKVREAFRLLYSVREKTATVYRDADLSTLSMGMSDDYVWAIEEGSNMIRPGRVIFGER